MKLSVELFNEIVTSLKSDGRRSQGHEKRAQGRVGLRCTLEIVIVSAGDGRGRPVSIVVHDVSKNGIGLVSSTRIEEGTNFVARFVRDGQSAVPVLYKVKYCRRLTNDLFSIGAMFQTVMADAAGAIAPIGKVAKAEQRRAREERQTTDKSRATVPI